MREKKRGKTESRSFLCRDGSSRKIPRASYEIYKQREAGALQTIYDDMGACR